MSTLHDNTHTHNNNDDGRQWHSLQKTTSSFRETVLKATKSLVIPKEELDSGFTTTQNLKLLIS